MPSCRGVGGSVADNQVITLRDIHKSYGSLEVLRGIDLDVHPGEVLAIVGPSGAGKTTLLQVMGTLETPDSGRICFGDTDVSALREVALARFRNRNIGFVFQFHRLLPEFDVVENVAIPAMIGGMNRTQAMDKARSLVEYLGLGARLHHRPAELSGGEQQRVAVARALVNDPAVILADEPSGSLDSENRRQLHRLFFDLRDDRGQTFVIVTHDESLAADADRIVHMADGRITDIAATR